MTLHTRSPAGSEATSRVITRRALLSAVWPLVVGLGATACTVGSAIGSRSPGSRPRFFLYVSDSPGGQRLVQIDPETLADLWGEPAFDPGAPTWVLSADGSTLVTIEYRSRSQSSLQAREVTIVVRDGGTGAERARFHPPAPVVFPRLSRDGTRLVVQLAQGGTATRPLEWYVLETATGSLLATVSMRDWAGTAGLHNRIDAEARRLYQLAVSGTHRGLPEEPPPVFLLAHDLATGAEVRRLPLPGLIAGSWWSDRTMGGARQQAHVMPALALSPDGQRLVIVHADAEVLTLIDARTVTPTGTVTLKRPTGVLDRLSLGPRVAFAKTWEGTTRQALFAPDGRHLYVSGLRSTLGARGQPTYRGLGLLRVQVDRAMVTAEALHGERISQMLPTPDGRHVYVFGPEVGTHDGVSPDSATYRLRWLDGGTLAVLADRRFAGFRSLLLRPRTWP